MRVHEYSTWSTQESINRTHHYVRVQQSIPSTCEPMNETHNLHEIPSTECTNYMRVQQQSTLLYESSSMWVHQNSTPCTWKHTNTESVNRAHHYMRVKQHTICMTAHERSMQFTWECNRAHHVHESPSTEHTIYMRFREEQTWSTRVHERSIPLHESSKRARICMRAHHESTPSTLQHINRANELRENPSTEHTI